MKELESNLEVSKLLEVVVFLTSDYSKKESIFIPVGTPLNEITKIVSKTFLIWYYYDVVII